MNYALPLPCMLSKKTQYALQALTYLAGHHPDGPVLIAVIAQKKKIPLKFLEGILLELKRGNVLESKKGKGGGYFLATEPSKINLAKVIRMMEGPIALLPCVSLNFYKKCDNCDETICGLNKVMCEARDASLSVLENRTVADLIVNM